MAVANIPNVDSPETIAALKERIAQLETERAAKSKITFKVSEKGAVSVYGLGRFPVTLYGEQWGRLMEKYADLKAFIEANRSKLSTK